MSKHPLIVILVSISSFVSVGQEMTTLSGKITNSQNGNLEGATITLLNTAWATISDSSGNFVFSDVLPGHYTIHVSIIGYAATNVEADVLKNHHNFIEISLLFSSVNLDELIVTAQKKEEVLQKIPISITALSARQIKDYRIWHNNELTAIVPNLYSANPGDDRNVTSVRGITTTSYDPAVATYIDGVNQFGLDTYIPTLVDAERIEVLRGPQGSLYGRNAMGGVINIITKQPSNSPGGFAEISLGNYNQQRYSAGARVPLIKNKLYFGIAAVYQKRDGYYTNTFDNTTFDKQNSITGNYYLKYIPSSNWNFILNVKHHHKQNNGPFPLVVGVQDALANPFKLMQNAVATMMDNTLNGSLSINNSNAFFNFSSQTAYQSNYRYYNAPLDGDFSPIDGVTIINDYGKNWNKVKVFTQEFKFTSPATSNSRLNWTAGTYFFFQDNPVKQTTHFGEDAALIGSPDNNFSLTNINKGKGSGFAIYGQISYLLTKKLELITGLRIDYEKKKYSVRGEYQKQPDPPFETRTDTSASASFHAVSPRLGLSYLFSQNSKAYFTYNRGYRTGGLTPLSADPSQPPLFPYQPEFSNNFEMGIKNTIWKNKLRLNISLFITQVSDVQVPTLVLPDAITIIRNAGKLLSKGIELELSATPVKNLQVDYNFGYTHAAFTSLKIPQNGTEVDLSGKKQVFTPATTSMLSIQYLIPITKNGNYNFVMRGEWENLGKVYFDLSNNITQDPYSLFNAKAGITTKRIELYFWTRNISNEKYIAYAYDFGAIHLGDPKTYGITLSAKF